MRQIHVCAWLAVSSWAWLACSGEKFTPSERSDTSAEGAVANGSGGTSYLPAASGSNNAGVVTSGGNAGSLGSSGGRANAGKSSGGSAGKSSSEGGADSGQAGDASSDCPSGSITFRMLPAPDMAHDYLCDAGCGTGWLTITDAEGAQAFSIFSACGTASCDSCEVQGCAAAACLPKPLTAEGSQLEWTGNYLAKGTCGANLACQKQACVKPGKYKAKACAAINAGSSGPGGACLPKNEQLCAEAEFEFPATETVQLVLKQ